MAILVLRKFFSDYKKTGETVPYFSSKSMASHTSFSFTYQVCSSQMQQKNIIKHLDSFTAALLSDKDPCHYISAAVMMNLISRLRPSFCFFLWRGQLSPLYAPPPFVYIHAMISQPANLHSAVQPRPPVLPKMKGDETASLTNKLTEFTKRVL